MLDVKVWAHSQDMWHFLSIKIIQLTAVLHIDVWSVYRNC